MSTSADPTTSTKPRLPKAYTEEQLAFLRSHLPEFERRSSGSVRGDAKKFALDKASEFINKFGLPSDFDVTPGIDAESRFREVSTSGIRDLTIIANYNHCVANIQLV
jgi:hypothetical protein